MGFLISFFAAFQTVLGLAEPIIGGIENFLAKLGIYTRHAKGISLTDYAKNTRVRPITVISKDLLAVKELDPILLNVLNVFIAYYIQAFSVDNIKVNNVSVNKILYKYNPDASSAFESLDTSFIAKENYEFGLPGTIGLEANNNNNNTPPPPRIYSTINKTTSIKEAPDLSKDRMNTPLAKDANRSVEENDLFKVDANLSVGKLINLNLTMPYNTQMDKKINTNSEETNRDEKGNLLNYKIDQTTKYEKGINSNTTQEVVIPVLIQLASVVLSNEFVVNLIAHNSVSKSFSERWVQYKSGQIRFIQDLILCNDIIDQEKKLLLSDESDTYLNILKRIQKSQKNALLGADSIGFAAASNIYIISEEVAKEIEYQTGAKLSSSRLRNKLFEGNYGMILVVIDRSWERATFYYRNMDQGTQVSFSSLVKSNNKNMDIYEIYKTFNNGGSPIF